MMRPWWMWKIGKAIVVAVVAALVLGVVTMLLWNALIPELFHGPALTYLQAVGLLILTHIFFRGWVGGHHRGWKHRRWRERMEERLSHMSPEERDAFKEELRRRCGFDPDEHAEDSKTSA